ncbi:MULTISPECIES: hypothetical protein [unclassified Rhizobium]|uniref:antitoxin VbhA family protein n=1 Tax=unclassified Rhizobium TaxID=2613769 RepID=UPI0007EBA7D2|nr:MULTISPECIES: hypothetical protein [unclassified Rhizobium]ANL12018.1 hypothetical protein AMJ98_PA00072 [Rhizobium sp. N1341]ANM42863.1 hypothetical protein AMK03_PA00072 [Rhizobium sp. N741]
MADVVANSRLSGYEVPEDIKATLLQIARGEISTDDAIANLERDGRRRAFEKVDQIEPFAHVPSTPEGDEIRARWIAGEITAEEAIAAFDEEIRKITE